MPYSDDGLSVVGLVGSALSPLLADKAAVSYSDNVMSKPTQERYKGRTGDVALIKNLVRDFESKGGQMVNGANYYDTVKKQYRLSDTQMDAVKSNKNGAGVQVFEDMYANGPQYQPRSKRVFIPGFNEGSKPFPATVLKDKLKGTTLFGPYTTPGMYAHEMGHAFNYRAKPDWMNRVTEMSGSAFGKGVPVAIGAASPFLDDDTLGYVGGAASAVKLPQFAEEAAASARGYGMLRRLGAGRGKALGAFIGLPTYLGITAMPMLPWAVRKVDRAVNG